VIWDDLPTEKRPTQEDLARFRQKIQDDIERVGWSVVAVMDNPPFAYTVGLTESYDHPELIIYGIGAKNAHQILANAVQHIKEGEVYRAGGKYSEILDGYDVEFRVHQEYPLTAATSYYRALGKDWEALQLVWPDADGNFPGEEGMDPEFEEVQKPKQITLEGWDE
jgi:uncharacterized protein DUF4262